MIGRQGNGLRLKVSIFPQVVGSSFSSNTVTGHLICWPWLHVQVWVPLSAPIGQWQITVVTWVNNRRGKHLVEKMNIFQGRRFERAQGWEPDLCAFQPLASRRPNPHAKVFNCQDLYCKLLPVKERGLSSWWRRRERSTPGLIRNLAAGFFKWIKWCLHKTTTLQTVGVRSILSDGASRSLPSSPHLTLSSPCRESQPC